MILIPSSFIHTSSYINAPGFAVSDGSIRLHFDAWFQALCKFIWIWGAVIAQWILLRLPSCHPGSSPKHTIYIFLNLYLNCVTWKRRKWTQRSRDWPIKKVFLNFPKVHTFHPPLKENCFIGYFRPVSMRVGWMNATPTTTTTMTSKSFSRLIRYTSDANYDAQVTKTFRVAGREVTIVNNNPPWLFCWRWAIPALSLFLYFRSFSIVDGN